MYRSSRQKPGLVACRWRPPLERGVTASLRWAEVDCDCTERQGDYGKTTKHCPALAFVQVAELTVAGGSSLSTTAPHTFCMAKPQQTLPPPIRCCAGYRQQHDLKPAHSFSCTRLNMLRRIEPFC